MGQADQQQQNNQQYQQFMREYHRRKSQYSGANGGPQVVIVSQRGEGNSGGIGEGMQYQNKLNNKDSNMQAGQTDYNMQMSQLKNQSSDFALADGSMKQQN